MIPHLTLLIARLASILYTTLLLAEMYPNPGWRLGILLFVVYMTLLLLFSAALHLFNVHLEQELTKDIK